MKTLNIVLTDNSYSNLRELKSFWRLSNLDSTVERCIQIAMDQNKEEDECCCSMVFPDHENV